VCGLFENGSIGGAPRPGSATEKDHRPPVHHGQDTNTNHHSIATMCTTTQDAAHALSGGFRSVSLRQMLLLITRFQNFSDKASAGKCFEPRGCLVRESNRATCFTSAANASTIDDSDGRRQALGTPKGGSDRQRHDQPAKRRSSRPVWQNRMSQTPADLRTSQGLCKNGLDPETFSGPPWALRHTPPSRFADEGCQHAEECGLGPGLSVRSMPGTDGSR